MQGQVAHHADTLNFIFDTGSGGISLDSQTVADLHLPQEKSNQVVRGIAGMHVTNFVTNEVLKLSGLEIDSLRFHIGNYEVLTSFYGERIHGIIGYSVLSRYIVKIDFDSTIISFYSQGEYNYPRNGYMLKPHILHVPEQEATIKDGKEISARFLYDLGAGVSVMLSNDFVNKNLPMGKRKLSSKMAQGVGGKVDMKLTVLKRFKLGNYSFYKVPTYLFEDVYHLTSYRKLGGIIGIDLLRRFNIILNYSQEEFYITPNSHFRDKFDYSYSGMELCHKQGHVFICDIVPQSPADNAGLKTEDIVISIGADFSNNLQQYKTILQKAEGNVTLIVSRNGSLLKYKIRMTQIN